MWSEYGAAGREEDGRVVRLREDWKIGIAWGNAGGFCGPTEEA